MHCLLSSKETAGGPTWTAGRGNWTAGRGGLEASLGDWLQRVVWQVEELAAEPVKEPPQLGNASPQEHVSLLPSPSALTSCFLVAAKTEPIIGKRQSG